MKIELNSEEVKVISEVLKYAMDTCPVESIGEEVDITAEKIEAIVAKLEKASKSK